jgi:hypothetical protein
MASRDPAGLPPDEPVRLSTDDLALRLGVARQRVAELADAGAIEADEDGRFDPGDVHRVRLLLAFETAGVPIEALLQASRAGRISLRYYDQLHPQPVAFLAGRTPSSGRRWAPMPLTFRSSSRRSGWPSPIPTPS